MQIINKRGQSTVEYVLLVTAVLAVMILFLTKPGSGLQSQLNTTLDDAGSQMTNMSGRLAGAEPSAQ